MIRVTKRVDVFSGQITLNGQLIPGLNVNNVSGMPHGLATRAMNTATTPTPPPQPPMPEPGKANVIIWGFSATMYTVAPNLQSMAAVNPVGKLNKWKSIRFTTF